MNGLKLIETVALDSSSVRITAAGYLVANAKCARTGIQEYHSSELGLNDNKMLRVWRSEDEVFSEASLATYAGQPATDDHPPVLVDASNWKDLSIGNIGNKVVRNGDFVEVPLILMDGAAIEKYNNGKVELSMGYLADWELVSGTTPDGEQYDAVQRNLRMNHIALVDKGRAGSAVRIGDSWSSDPKPTIEISTMQLKNIVVDGLAVETTDAGAQAITKLQTTIAEGNKALADANKALNDANTAHTEALSVATATNDAALADKDVAIATKDAEIVELKKQVVTGEALDAMVAARSALIAKAKSFAKDADFKGKTDTQIKAIAVDAKYGAEFSAGRVDAAIDALFDSLKEDEQKEDPVLKALHDFNPTTEPVNDNGYAARCKALEDAHKGAQA